MSLGKWLADWDGAERHKMSVSMFYDWSRNCFVFGAKPKKEVVPTVQYTFRMETQNKMKPPTGFDCEGNPIYPPAFESKEMADEFIERQLLVAKRNFEIAGVL